MRYHYPYYPLLIALVFDQLPSVVASFFNSPELVEKSVLHDNETRWFIEYQPDALKLDNEVKPPVVIWLHGGGGSMRETLSRFGVNIPSSRWIQLSDENDFLLLVPNGVNLETGDTFGDQQTWTYLLSVDDSRPRYDDVGFISKLVEYAINERNVDPTRVYISGMSLGGLMTFTLLVRVPELFAAGAAFIANLPSFPIDFPNQTTPIMMMNGNRDRIMLFDGGPLDGGIIRTAPETRNFWTQANQAILSSVVRTSIPNRSWLDRCRIRSEFYPANRSDNTSDAVTDTSAPVQFYTMDGGGHFMPSRRGLLSPNILVREFFFGGACHDANGADLAWTFLSSYTKSL
jgi:polyhydroxybutyrate depolymerase